MGGYEFGPQRVHRAVTRLLASARLQPEETPPWIQVVRDYPPSERMVRPALQASKKKRGRASKMFKPVEISYPEDSLRREFFGDHPWELARPRTVLEDDGKDYQMQDWTRLQYPGRQFSGESVIQRQMYLMRNEGMTKLEAYDVARKEFYRIREAQDIQRRIAQEEARHVGAHFRRSILDVASDLEDKEFEKWKAWASKEAARIQQLQSAAYSGTEIEEDVNESEEIEAEGSSEEPVAVEAPISR